jgi:hypothetical protein
MQISLRSQLIAGTAAVVGASAIAMTPVTSAHLSLPSIQAPSAVQAALVAFSSPLAALSETFILTSQYLFNQDLNPANPAAWPYANFGTEFGNIPDNIPGVIPGLLTSPELPNPSPPPALVFNPFGTYTDTNQGLLPQIINDGLPIISQLGFNGSEYLNATFTSLGLAGVQLGTAIRDSIAALVSFDIPGSIEALLTGVSQVGSTLLNAGGFVLTGVVNRLTAVVEATIGLVPTLLGATLRQIQVVGDSVGTVFNNFFNAFSSGTPIESAWNAVVDGLLGPTGIPGTLVNLTIGAGVQTGAIPLGTPAEIEASIADNFVPSIRTEVQTGVNVITNALQTPVVSSAAAAPAAAAVAAVEAPAEVETPAVVEVAEVEAPAAVEAPASARGARAAAVVDAPAAVEAPAAAQAPAATAGDDDGAAKKTPKRAARGAKKAS